MSVTESQLVVNRKELVAATALITYAVPAGGYNGALTSQFAETVSTYNGNNKLQWDVSPTGNSLSISAASTLARGLHNLWVATGIFSYSPVNGATNQHTAALSIQETVSHFLLAAVGSYGGDISNWCVVVHSPLIDLKSYFLLH